MKLLALILYLSIFQFTYANPTVERLMEFQKTRIVYDHYMQSYPVDPERIPTLSEEFLLEKNHPLVNKLDKERRRIHAEFFSWPAFKKKYEKLYLKTYTKEELEYLLSIYQTDIGRSILRKHGQFPFLANTLDRETIQKFNAEIKKINSEYESALQLELQEKESNQAD